MQSAEKGVFPSFFGGTNTNWKKKLSPSPIGSICIYAHVYVYMFILCTIEYICTYHVFTYIYIQYPSLIQHMPCSSKLNSCCYHVAGWCSIAFSEVKKTVQFHKDLWHLTWRRTLCTAAQARHRWGTMWGAVEQKIQKLKAVSLGKP